MAKECPGCRNGSDESPVEEKVLSMKLGDIIEKGTKSPWFIAAFEAYRKVNTFAEDPSSLIETSRYYSRDLTIDQFLIAKSEYYKKYLLEVINNYREIYGFAPYERIEDIKVWPKRAKYIEKLVKANRFSYENFSDGQEQYREALKTKEIKE